MKLPLIGSGSAFSLRPIMLDRVTTFFFVLVGVYGVGLTLFIFARWIGEDRLPALAWFNALAQPLFFVALILLPLCVIQQRHWAALSLFPAVVILVVSYGPFFVPRQVAASDKLRDIRVMSFNLKAKNMNLRELESVILEAGPDVIALQEVNHKVAAYFEDTLLSRYPYIRLHEREGNIGMGVLSRFPVLSDDYWLIESSHQRITIDVEGQPVTLFNSRMLFPLRPGAFTDQRDEFKQILAEVQNERGPLIWVGDFNMSDQSDNYRDVSAALVDSYREVGWGMGFTFPAAVPDLPLPRRLRESMTIPVIRVDYIFHNQFFATRQAQVWPDSGESDHHPIYAILEMQQ